MPIRILITNGTTADCTQAGKLIEGISAEYLLADKGYDSDHIIRLAKQQGMKPTIYFIFWLYCRFKGLTSHRSGNMPVTKPSMATTGSLSSHGLCRKRLQPHLVNQIILN